MNFSKSLANLSTVTVLALAFYVTWPRALARLA